MSDGIIDPRTDPSRVGDEVDEWDAWLEGDIDLNDLSPELQQRAREFLANG